MKAVFMGTPDFAVPALSALIAAGHEIVAVYTQPPRPAGRGMAERKSPVHVLAETHGLKVLVPKSLKGAAEQAAFCAHNADVAAVVAYGLLLPKAVLDAPRFGCLNGHASRLPRWRGAAPIQRAILAGDTETAATIMRMEEGLDTGPICLEKRVEIGPDMTAGELHDVLAAATGPLMVEALALLARGALPERPQPEDGICYAAKIGKSESKLDFGQDAQKVHNHIRAFSPFPGAWFEASNGSGARERIKVLRSRMAAGSGHAGGVTGPGLTVTCAHGAVELLELQRAGKKTCSAEEFLRGYPLGKGARINHD